MLFLGRHDAHIRYLFPSFRTETSKTVPSLPPMTGFPSYFVQAPDVCAISAVSAGRLHANTLNAATKIKRFFMRFYQISSTSMPVNTTDRPISLLTHQRCKPLSYLSSVCSRDTSLCEDWPDQADRFISNLSVRGQVATAELGGGCRAMRSLSSARFGRTHSASTSKSQISNATLIRPIPTSRPRWLNTSIPCGKL